MTILKDTEDIENPMERNLFQNYPKAFKERFCITIIKPGVKTRLRLFLSLQGLTAINQYLLDSFADNDWESMNS